MTSMRPCATTLKGHDGRVSEIRKSKNAGTRDTFAVVQDATRARPGEQATRAQCAAPAVRAFPGKDSQHALLRAKCTCAPAPVCVIPVEGVRGTTANLRLIPEWLAQPGT